MDIFSHPSFDLSTIVATAFYAFVGVFIMIISVTLFDKLFKLDLHKELVEDENLAFGVLFAGMAIGVSIIIGASIVG